MLSHTSYTNNIGLYDQRTHRSLWQKPHSSYSDQTRPAATSVTSRRGYGVIVKTNMLSYTSYNKTHKSLWQKPHSACNDQTRPAVTSVTSQLNGGAVTALFFKLVCFRTRLIPPKIGLYDQRTHRSLGQKPHSSYNDQLDLQWPP